MAILVDELREYPDVALPFTTWCHMATDGDLDELHAFAARLGLRRRWFQRDHYDLPPHGRRAAVALGAEEVGTGELLRRMTGPRGDRARRRALAPDGVAWLRGGDGPAVLRYPAGALVAIGGPPGAGKSTLAARAVDARAAAGPRPRRPARRPRPARGARGVAGGAGRRARGRRRGGGHDRAARGAPARAGEGGRRRRRARPSGPARRRRRRPAAPAAPHRARHGSPTACSSTCWPSGRRTAARWRTSATPRRSPRSPCSTARPPTACAGSRSHPPVEGELGAGEGTRTPALSLTRRVLYQLSYSGTRSPESRAARRRRYPPHDARAREDAALGQGRRDRGAARRARVVGRDLARHARERAPARRDRLADRRPPRRGPLPRPGRAPVRVGHRRGQRPLRRRRHAGRRDEAARDGVRGARRAGRGPPRRGARLHGACRDRLRPPRARDRDGGRRARP